MMKAILERLKEPSTWAGLSALGVLFGLPPGSVDLVGQVVIGIAGTAAVVVPETKPADRRGVRKDRRVSHA